MEYSSDTDVWQYRFLDGSEIHMVDVMAGRKEHTTEGGHRDCWQGWTDGTCAVQGGKIFLKN